MVCSSSSTSTASGVLCARCSARSVESRGAPMEQAEAGAVSSAVAPGQSCSQLAFGQLVREQACQKNGKTASSLSVVFAAAGSIAAATRRVTMKQPAHRSVPIRQCHSKKKHITNAAWAAAAFDRVVFKLGLRHAHRTARKDRLASFPHHDRLMPPSPSTPHMSIFLQHM